jgi:hypothetical protein
MDLKGKTVVITGGNSGIGRATAQNSSGEHLAVWLTKVLMPVGTVNLTARMLSGVPSAFPLSYGIYVTKPQNTGWVYVGNYTNQPNASGAVKIALPQIYSTHGVWLVPQTLGADPYGTHYFQLRELSLGN